MKWQYVIVCLLLITCVGSVGAVRENFQSWGTSSSLSINPGAGANAGINNVMNTSIGQIGLYNPLTSTAYTIINTNPIVFSYAAFDAYSPGTFGSTPVLTLYDSAHNAMAVTGRSGGITYASYPPGQRVEVNIVGMVPKLYIDGVFKGNFGINPGYGSGGALNIYPSYFGILGYGGEFVDNILIGESDPHVVGALPSNWTIQRDLINPFATGVYSWNNATQTWVSQNSQYFYIDADTDSQDSIYTENFDIVNFNIGNIVNTTVIDSTIPRHQIQYNIGEFLGTGASALPDGMYYAQFRGYPDSRSYFWVISSGASVSWNQNTYAQGSPATITYAVSNSYWSPATYTYRVDVIDTTGTVKKTQTITSQTGTVSIANLDSTTYPAGAYYAEVIAHDTSDHVMAYAAMEVTDYIYLSGYAMNAETGAVVSNANVTVSQGSTTVSYISSSSGWGNTSSYWLTGSDITIQTTLSGYSNDIQTITPLAAGSIAFNISLMPSPATSTGISVGGIVRQGDPTGITHPIPNPIPNTAYYTKNGSEYICTTNIAGYCRNNNLVNGTIYDVWSSKTGYSNSTVEKKLAVGT